MLDQPVGFLLQWPVPDGIEPAKTSLTKAAINELGLAGGPGLHDGLGVPRNVNDIVFPELDLAKDMFFNAFHNLEEISFVVEGRGQTVLGELFAELQQRRIQLESGFQVRSGVDVVTRFRVLLKPWAVVGRVIPDNISHSKQIELILHPSDHVRNVLLTLLEEGLVEDQLVSNAVWRIGRPAHHKRSKMNHIVATLADSPQMIVPVDGVTAHEFGQCREDADSLDRQVLAMQLEIWTYVDVVCVRSCGFRRCNVCEGPLRQWPVGRVEGEGIGLVNGNLNLTHTREVGLQPTQNISDM